MKNKIINLAIAGVLFVALLLTTIPVQAQTLNQRSALLGSVSQLGDSFTKLLASVASILINQAGEGIQQATTAQQVKGIAETIQTQTQALKIIAEENKGTGAGSIISHTAQEISPAVKQLSKTLKPGDSNQDVQTLQEYLSTKPELYPDQLVTGYYGPLTKQGVINLQKEAGLEMVGIVGPKTLAVINRELAEETGSTTDTFPAWTLSDYTIALLNIANELKHAPATQKQAVAKRLAEYANGRKDLVLQTIAKNPDAVLQNVFPSLRLASVPADIQNLIEQKRQVRGKFEWIHIHWGDFDTGTTVDEFYVTESATNKRYKVHLNEYPHALTDDMVVIDGVVLDDQIATTEASIKVTSSPNNPLISALDTTPSLLKRIDEIFRIQKAKAQTANVQKKVVVIMFNWQNDIRTSFTESSARGTFFTNTNSSNNYYKENSFGKEELVGKLRSDGDVFGWVTIPYDNTNCSSMYSTWAKAADAQLQAQGVDLSGYNIKSYVFPSVSCGWSGLASIGGNPARSWMNTTALGTITHELGHNLGAHHASSWSCTENGVRVAISADANCLLGEYGDPYDVMGSSGGMRHMNNYHKGITIYSLNWLDPVNTLTIDRNVSPDATYTISPIEQASAGVQSLRIPRTISGTSIIDYYYIEFRQPIGFDTTIPIYATNGVTIRIAPNYTTTAKSKLVDTIPGTSSFSDAPLAVGKTFTDPYKAINISTLSVAPTGAQVRVSFGTLPCVRANPTLSISPFSATVFSGQSASFNYILTNNDTLSCSSSNFSLTSTLPTGFSQSPSPITHASAPGASVSGSFIISTPTDATPSSYSVSETAQNTSTSTIYKSTVSLTMNILPPDTTPPIVTITSPADGTTVSKGNVAVSASASDASGIAEMQLLIDGGLIKTCYNTTSCSGRVSVNGLNAGVHTITAQATDKGGPVTNVNSTSLIINKK